MALQYTSLMIRRVELIESTKDISLLTGLWLSPSPDALKSDWKIPNIVKIGLASQNPAKINKVSSILRQHGSQMAISSPPPEDAIKVMLRQLWEKRESDLISADSFRVANIAGCKSLLTFSDDQSVTHSLGLDTDVVALGENIDELNEPIGQPKNTAELLDILRLISGRTLAIKTAAAFADVQLRAILAIEEVRILLKLKQFEIGEYLDTIGFEAIGRFPGAIDFSTEVGAGFLDPNFMLRVSRIVAFSEPDTKKLVWVDPKATSSVLGDYFNGCPEHLVNWVLYNGLLTNNFIPFPL